MKKNLKWNIEKGITFTRRNWNTLLVKYDVSDYWFTTNYFGWTGTQRETFRRVGKLLGANTCELRMAYDENDNPIVSDEEVMIIVELTEETLFRQELDVPERTPRKFNYFEIEKLLRKETN